MKKGLPIVAASVFLFTIAYFAIPAGGQQKKDEKKDEKTDKPAATAAAAPAKKPTAKVEKAPIKVEVSVKGVFEAQDMTEVALRPEAWSSFTVLKGIEQGARVVKGDTLLTLDFEKIDLAVKDLETERKLGDLGLKQSEEELKNLEKTAPLDLTAAQRSKAIADEDRKRFFEIDKAQSLKNAEFALKNALNMFEYQKEELKQLEKMYKADDLTEETEEIILKRTRDQVEYSRHLYESSKINHDRAVKIELPRREESVVRNAEREELSLAKSQITIPLSVEMKRLSLEKARGDREKSAERLQKLQKDREMMLMKSPADGIVYYGKCTKGNWSTASTVAGRLQRGGSLSSEEVILTIVRPRPIFIRAAVEEKDLGLLRPGLEGKATPAAFPDSKLSAKVESVSGIPMTGTFDARIAVEIGKDGDAIMPGMACSLKFIPYKKEDALTVPTAAVFADDLDEEQFFVYVAAKDGKAEKREVAVGKKSGTKTEILRGLKEGEEIFLEKPEKR